MSETREAWTRLKQGWKDADYDTRHRFVSRLIGLALCGAAIVAVFGGWGFAFTLGTCLVAVSGKVEQGGS